MKDYQVKKIGCEAEVSNRAKPSGVDSCGAPVSYLYSFEDGSTLYLCEAHHQDIEENNREEGE